ncbi:osmoprotectant transport system permease protein [Brevibacterium sanguinis]|uniref:Osmoprotectant transport system permease protein n=2 Tax=Brevibacterium TaxID=1696 RepID=A0A366IK07_9MICO|nr:MULTISPECIES: ABC transporter permease subunit [Brevibacterium]RBP64239.1 osmoprotectant transport system permease protein [Brevibacterium sanguinis]RBP71469.1 osmoprotectant transport system permease protein [Brevibacterium celere]
MNLSAEALAWLTDPLNWSGPGGIPTRLAEHVLISAAAVLIAAVIALPAGVLIGHSRRGAGVVGAIAGAARAVPTLGLLTLFGLGLGIGLEAPLLALIILAVPSLLAGAYAGTEAISPTITDSATAVGMSPAQVVLRVELPLAAPVIIGGIRAATLQVVATATLAAYTSDVGLGRYLFSGLKSRQYDEMLAAALLVTAVALLLEIGLAAWQRAARARIVGTPHAPLTPAPGSPQGRGKT